MKKNLLTFIIFSIASLLFGQSPILVKDFNPGVNDGIPDWGANYFQHKDLIFFDVQTSDKQYDLFVIKDQNPILLKNTCKDCTSSSTKFSLYKDNVIFVQNNDGEINLWKTKGTPNSTTKIGKLNENVSQLIEGKNGLLYVVTSSSIYITDGSSALKKLNTSAIKFSETYQNDDDKNVTKFKDGIAFLTNDWGDAALNYADTSIAVLKTFDLDFSFANLTGLTNIGDDLVFIEEDEGIRHYDAKTDSLSLKNFKDPLRMLQFGDDAVIAFTYNEGISILYGNPLQRKFLINKWGSVVQNSNLIKYVVDDKMILNVSDYNSFDEISLLIDKKDLSATVLGEIEAYPSGMVGFNDNIFFADGTSNGFSPAIYHLSGSIDALKKTYSYSASSNDGPSVIPIGLQGQYLFYFSNLDLTKGRELFKIKVDLNTASKDVLYTEKIEANINHKILNFNSEYKSLAYDYEIFTLDGKRIQKGKIKNGDEKYLNFNQTLVAIRFTNPSTGFNKTFMRFIQ
jgi:hypothetical protein